MAYDERKFASDMKAVVTSESFFDHSAAIEYKIKKAGKRLNFKSDFQPQQLEYLRRAAEKYVYHKISDIDPGLKPFDAMYLHKTKAYVIVCWYDKGKSKNVYVLPYFVLFQYIKSGAKSMSEADAKAESAYTIKI